MKSILTSCLKTNSYNPQGYILAIDSLVLKFEGLLHELSRMIGAQTIEIKDNGTAERIGFADTQPNSIKPKEPLFS